ncbi:hypothetical protein [Caulobacter sp. SSI4214]|uniref:hypothetical protein n=1 Tax=Caulobacter sp. SSI4214 TaxID=2575739 RepID=UPI00143A87F2|nr:hypothetical protein [Caulobacter sp. SSI4214]
MEKYRTKVKIINLSKKIIIGTRAIFESKISPLRTAKDGVRVLSERALAHVKHSLLTQSEFRNRFSAASFDTEANKLPCRGYGSIPKPPLTDIDRYR